MAIHFKNIGVRIKEIRKKNQLTQARLAESVDLSSSYISRIETGSKKASLGPLIRIAEEFKVSLDYLVFGGEL
ncbi:MAG: helix-turn-helix domain-containing protein [Oscillospiraceae bacterium]|nr:helix-turn-helix domain-containing protein [Oscillospiraceae bacterium]